LTNKGRSRANFASATRLPRGSVADDERRPAAAELTASEPRLPSTFAEFIVGGTVVVGSGYRKVPVTHLASNGSLSGRIAMSFAPAGNKGADGTGGDMWTFVSSSISTVLARPSRWRSTVEQAAQISGPACLICEALRQAVSC
jgi:hypothetical protein